MKQTEEKQERLRKAYAARGERSQKMMSFRVDNEVTEWLNQQSNKGRYLNALILEDRKRHQ